MSRYRAKGQLLEDSSRYYKLFWIQDNQISQHRRTQLNAVTADLKSKQLLLIAFATNCRMQRQTAVAA